MITDGPDQNKRPHEHPHVSFWRRLYRRGRISLLKLAEPKRLLGLLILLLALSWAWSQVTKDVVTITTFSAPKALEDKGFSGAYLTNLVADQIAEFENASYSMAGHHFQPASGENIPELEIPETKISLKTIIQFLRTVVPERFVKAVIIDGDLGLDGSTARWVVRIHRPSESNPVIIGPFQWTLTASRETTATVKKVAEGIVTELDPVMMANYYYFIDPTPDRAVALAQVAHAPSSRSAADLELFLGTVALDKGDIANAKAIFQRVLSIHAEYPPALNLLGRYYEIIEDPKDSLEYYRAAVRRRKGSPELLNNLAFRYLDDGNLPLALQYFESSLTESPNFTSAYRGIAYVYDSLGASNKALITLKQGVALS